MELKKELRTIGKRYGVKVRFMRIRSCGARACLKSGTVEMDISQCKSRSKALCFLFHELGHFYCYENGKYKFYHNPKGAWSLAVCKRLMRTALRAERYVDNWAGKELKNYDKRVKYDYVYHNDPDAQKFLKEYYYNSLKLKKNFWENF